MSAVLPDGRFPEGAGRVTALPCPECETMVSVVRGRNDFDIRPPTPTDAPEFEDEMRLFSIARRHARQDTWPAEFFQGLGANPEPSPVLLAMANDAGKSPWRCAIDFVSADAPLDIHQIIRSKVDFSIKQPQIERSPQQCGIDFLGTVDLDWEVAGAIRAALYEAFQVKYFFAQPRPSSHFQAGPAVEEQLCPGHHSYVAGHGSYYGAIASTWAELADIGGGPDQIHDLCFQLAHARTGNGNHWPEDNTEGFSLGQMVVAKRLFEGSQ